MWFFIRHAESSNNASNNNDSIESSNKFNDERVPDPCLTEKGLKQAEKTSIYLASEQIKIWQQNKDDQKIITQIKPIFVAIYCSPMQRSLETANIIQKKLNCPVFVNPDLCEVGGVFHGKRYVKDNGTNNKLCSGQTRNEILNKFPNFQLDERINEDGWWQKPQETIKEAIVRANKVSQLLWEISSNETEKYGIDSQKRVNILITHGLFQDMLMKKLLLNRDSLSNSEESAFFPCENCAISQISLCNYRINNQEEINRICICLKWNSTDHLNNEERTTARIYPNMKRNN